MRKKVAILIGGLFRKLEYTHKTWSFLNDIEYDIFFSTWDYTFEKNLWYHSIPEEIKKPISKNDILKYFPKANINIETDDNSLSYHDKMFYHWNKLLNMMDETQYDIIILTRSDIAIKEKKSLSNFIDLINDDCIYGLGPIGLDEENEVYVQDCLFLGKSKYFKKIFNKIDIIGNLKNVSPHVRIGNYFLSNNIILKYIHRGELDIIDWYIYRDIHTFFKNENFDTNVFIANNYMNCSNLKDLKDLVENKKLNISIIN